jgi:hypothetical protein
MSEESQIQQHADVPDLEPATKRVNKWGVPLLSNGKPDLDEIAKSPDRWVIKGEGMVYGLKEKHVVAKSNDPSVAKHAITKENSLDLHKRHSELILEAHEAAREGIARHLGRKTYLEAHADIAGSMAKLAIAWDDDPKLARASVEAARLAGVMTGALSERGNNAGNSDGSPTQNIYNIGTDALQQVIEAIQQAKTRRQDGDNGVIDV